MKTVWAYPWALESQGLERACAELTKAGVDRIAVAAHYHSIRTLTPRVNGNPFTTYPGGCYFTPDLGEFKSSSIVPPVNNVEGLSDPLEEIVDTANAEGITVSAWTVCLHNSRLGTENPSLRPVGPYGTKHDHGVCPSNRAVKGYLSAVVGTIAGYDVDRIDLESIGYPTAMHPHGESFGHLKNYGGIDDVSSTLLSQCFCKACRTRAPFNMDTMAKLVRDILDQTLNEAGRETTIPLSELEGHFPELEKLKAFRQDVITDLVAEISDAGGEVPLHYYVADGIGRDVEDGLWAGVDLERLSSHLGSVTGLYYSNDMEGTSGRVEQIRDRTGLDTSAGITVDPCTWENRADWLNAVQELKKERPSGLHVYNHSLMTKEHLDWVQMAEL